MEKSPYPSDALDRYIVRFPKGMRDRLKSTAQSNNRTLNAEIVARLEESFQEKTPPMTNQRLHDLLDRIGRNQDLVTHHVEMIRDMLARGVVDLAENLPPAVRGEVENGQIIDIAQAVLNNDDVWLTKILRSRIQGADAKVVEASAQVLAASNTSVRRKREP